MQCAKFGWDKPSASEEALKQRKTDGPGDGLKDRNRQTDGHGTTRRKFNMNTYVIWILLPTYATLSTF